MIGEYFLGDLLELGVKEQGISKMKLCCFLEATVRQISDSGTGCALYFEATVGANRFICGQPHKDQFDAMN